MKFYYIMKKTLKKLQMLTKKMQQTQKATNNFLNQIYKNYKTMKTKLKKIWLPIAIIVIIATFHSCNVTRVITNESQYYQKGDTAVTIQTKTIESYNAVKNN